MAGGNCRVDVWSPPGRLTRPAAVGGSGHRQNRRCGRGAFIHLSLSPQKDGRPPGRDPANHRRPKGHRTKRQRPGLDPACAGATNRARNAVPETKAHMPLATAKPNGSGLPLLQRRGAPGGWRELSRRCLSPQGRFDATRPGGRSEGTWQNRRGRAEPFLYPSFLSPQEDESPPRRDRQSPSAESTSNPNDKDQRPWTPARAVATNRRSPPCQRARRRKLPARARPKRASPFSCSSPGKNVAQPALGIAVFESAAGEIRRRAPPGTVVATMRPSPAKHLGDADVLLFADGGIKQTLTPSSSWGIAVHGADAESADLGLGTGGIAGLGHGTSDCGVADDRGTAWRVDSAARIHRAPVATLPAVGARGDGSGALGRDEVEHHAAQLLIPSTMKVRAVASDTAYPRRRQIFDHPRIARFPCPSRNSPPIATMSAWHRA